jgi:hypothetical protein
LVVAHAAPPSMSENSIKKSNKKSVGMRPEYDFAAMAGGVRGKFAKRYRAGTNLVLLDPEIRPFPPTKP